MGYNLTYGNPYDVPGVAQGVFTGARDTTNFARRIETTRLRLAERQQQLAEANFALNEDLAVMKQRLDERNFAMQGRQEDRLDADLRFRRDQLRRVGEDKLGIQADRLRQEHNKLRDEGAQPLEPGAQAPPDATIYTDGEGRPWIKRPPSSAPSAAELKKQQNDLRTERNMLRIDGFRPLESGEAAPEGAIVYNDGGGRQWVKLPTPSTPSAAEVKKQQDNLRQEHNKLRTEGAKPLADGAPIPPGAILQVDGAGQQWIKPAAAGTNGGSPVDYSKVVQGARLVYEQLQREFDRTQQSLAEGAPINAEISALQEKIKSLQDGHFWKGASAEKKLIDEAQDQLNALLTERAKPLEKISSAMDNARRLMERAMEKQMAELSLGPEALQGVEENIGRRLESVAANPRIIEHQRTREAISAAAEMLRSTDPKMQQQGLAILKKLEELAGS